MVKKKRTLRAIDLNGSPLDQFGGNEFEIWEDENGKVHITLDKEKDISGDTIDNWNAGGGGTEVIANPEMVGDEPKLEGLQVGEQKYRIFKDSVILECPLSDQSTFEEIRAFGDIINSYIDNDCNVILQVRVYGNYKLCPLHLYLRDNSTDRVYFRIFESNGYGDTIRITIKDFDDAVSNYYFQREDIYPETSYTTRDNRKYLQGIYVPDSNGDPVYVRTTLVFSNPELSGNENVLSSIEINGVKYKIFNKENLSFDKKILSEDELVWENGEASAPNLSAAMKAYLNKNEYDSPLSYEGWVEVIGEAKDFVLPQDFRFTLIFEDDTYETFSNSRSIDNGAYGDADDDNYYDYEYNNLTFAATSENSGEIAFDNKDNITDFCITVYNNTEGEDPFIEFGAVTQSDQTTPVKKIIFWMPACDTHYEAAESTKVIANPTLSGSEPVLQGLQVGNTKYRIPIPGTDNMISLWETHVNHDKISYIESGSGPYADQGSVELSTNVIDDLLTDLLEHLTIDPLETESTDMYYFGPASIVIPLKSPMHYIDNGTTYIVDNFLELYIYNFNSAGDSVTASLTLTFLGSESKDSIDLYFTHYQYEFDSYGAVLSHSYPSQSVPSPWFLSNQLPKYYIDKIYYSSFYNFVSDVPINFRTRERLLADDSHNGINNIECIYCADTTWLPSGSGSGSGNGGEIEE